MDIGKAEASSRETAGKANVEARYEPSVNASNKVAVAKLDAD